MERILQWDEQLLIWFNGFHVPWLDPIVLLITKTAFWIPLYVILIYLIFKYYKRDGWLVLAGAALTILLADQITSSIMKPYFARLRPSQEPHLAGIIHLVDGYKGGTYGFASSHAANTFGTALLMVLVLKPFCKWIGLIFIWAVGMTYTRLYLGVHYPGDILVGAIVGMLSAWAGYWFYKWLVGRRKT